MSQEAMDVSKCNSSQPSNRRDAGATLDLTMAMASLGTCSSPLAAEPVRCDLQVNKKSRVPRS